MATLGRKESAKPKKKSRFTEAEIAQAVMDELTSMGWDCYPEVVLPHGMSRADIVAVRPFPFMPGRKMVHIVECKSSWTLSLLEQGLHRTRFAHFVSLASQGRCSFMYDRLCAERRLGRIAIDSHRIPRSGGFELLAEPGNQIRSKNKFAAEWVKKLVDSLHPDMKNYRPGTTSAQGFSTPWRRTMDAAARFVADNPGCTVAEIVDSVPTHYVSIAGAKTGVLTWLQERDDVRLDDTDRPYRFYPAEASSS